MLKNFLIFSSLLICFGQIECVLNPKVVCYYESWFVYRPGHGKMTLDDIDNKLCTHIVYGYMGITTDNDVSIPDPNIMVDRHDLENLAKIKGSAKALVAIGGSTLSDRFASMVSNEADRNTFASNVVKFLDLYKIDGVTLDWTKGIWEEQDFADFTKLCYALYSKFDQKYILGVSVSSRPTNFESHKIDPYLDFITVQSFDLHGSWDKTVDYEAPLDWQFQVMNSWWSSGATMDKLLMSVPFYARTWTLEDSTKHDVGASATGPGKAGPWTESEGKLSYNELCTAIKEHPSDWNMKRDDSNACVYAYNDKQWVSYEDSQTLKQKSHNMTTEGFGGIVVQALANDDFGGLCGDKYPLLKAVNDGLNKDPVGPRTTPAPVTVTPDPNQFCQKVGTFRDPKDCNLYHICTEFFPGVFKDEQKNCAKDEGFDEKEQKCKDKKDVPECH